MNLSDLLVSGSLVAAIASPTAAQITVDGTTTTTLTPTATGIQIDDGDRAGNNLFHSFSDFSIPNNGSAFFNNASDIVNIFSRVTGGNISNIDGFIGANGTANLFLLNPAGIIFGAGARLDIGGSFYGSTADSIVFEDGEFSATDLTNPPLLTINAPIGLNFRDEPNPITTNNSSDVFNSNLNLIGGDITINSRLIGNKITLGGISNSGIVGFTEQGDLIFSEAAAKADVLIDNNAFLGVFSSDGSINIQGNNISVDNSSLVIAGAENDINIQAENSILIDNNSLIIAQVTDDQGRNAGDINLNTAQISLDNSSSVINQVGNQDIGNSGDININVDSLALNNASSIIAETRGTGDVGDININADNVELLNNSRLFAGIRENAGAATSQAGDIVINASDNISLDGNSSIRNQLANNGEGSAGNINVKTSSLTLNNRSSIGGQTAGIGSSGKITINADDSVEINSGSSLRSLVERSGKGNAGDIVINTSILNVETIEGTSENRSLMFSNTRGVGNAGNITINAADSITFNNSLLLAQVEEGANGNGGNIDINTPHLTVQNSATEITSGLGIFADTAGMGNAGNINITTDNELVIDRRSSISAGTTSEGNAGDINVTTDLLSLSNFALLSSNTRMNASGSAGTIIINAKDVDVSEGAIIAAFTSTDLTGGEIIIKANTLDIISGGNILTSSDGSGQAGDININISEQIVINGRNPAILPSEFVPFEDPILNSLNGISGLFASTTAQATGNGGNINIINTNASIVVSNDAQISVSSQGQGSGGNITIESQDLTLNNNSSITASTPSGQGGSISLAFDDNLTLSNESTITARAFNDANGGDIDIDANFVIAFPSQPNGSDIIASAQDGDGGNININAREIFGLQEGTATPGNGTNDIDVSSEFGLAGIVSIQTPDTQPIDSVAKLSANVVEQTNSFTQVCAANSNAGSSNFVIKGRGGIPAQPTEAFRADDILGAETSASAEVEIKSQELIKALEAQYPPITTDRGDIYPARGVIIKEDGTVTLTFYPTDKQFQRTLVESGNCSTSP